MPQNLYIDQFDGGVSFSMLTDKNVTMSVICWNLLWYIILIYCFWK